MWLLLAFLSAALLGFYDAFKKKSLRDNAVLPVLFLNTVFSSSTLHGRSSMPCNPHMKRTMRLFSIRTDTVTAMMRLTTPHSYSRILFQI